MTDRTLALLLVEEQRHAAFCCLGQRRFVTRHVSVVRRVAGNDGTFVAGNGPSNIL